ncbi:MAG: hypothetical protein NTV43_16190 [Methylococcales bacterium]|nr:hypothetical protein [Methylococcales bacterium]
MIISNSAFAICLPNVDSVDVSCRYKAGDSWCATNGEGNLFAFDDHCLQSRGKSSSTPVINTPSAGYSKKSKPFSKKFGDIWSRSVHIFIYCIYITLAYFVTEKICNLIDPENILELKSSFHLKDKKPSDFKPLWVKNSLSTFALKSCVFIFVATIILFRSRIMAQAINVNDQFIPLILAVFFGLVMALYPIFSSYTLAFGLLLIHFRALYLIILISKILGVIVIMILPIILGIAGGYIVYFKILELYGFDILSIAIIVYIAFIIGLAKSIKLLTSKIIKGYETILTIAEIVILKINEILTVLIIRFAVSIGGEEKELGHFLSWLARKA